MPPQMLICIGYNIYFIIWGYLLLILQIYVVIMLGLRISLQILFFMSGQKVDVHFVCERVKNRCLHVSFILSDSQIADIITKGPLINPVEDVTIQVQHLVSVIELEGGFKRYVLCNSLLG